MTTNWKKILLLTSPSILTHLLGLYLPQAPLLTQSVPVILSGHPKPLENMNSSKRDGWNESFIWYFHMNSTSRACRTLPLRLRNCLGKQLFGFADNTQSKTNACEQLHGSFLTAPLVKQGIQTWCLAWGLRDAACWFVTWSASTCTAKTKPVLADVPQESSWANLSSFRLLATFYLFIYLVQKLLFELYPETFPKASLIPHTNS